MKSIPGTRFYGMVIPSCGLAWLWVVYNLFSIKVDGITLCLIKRIVGIPCPACGTTRSVTEILNGHFSTGGYINPLGYLALFALIVLPIWLLKDLVQRNKSLYRSFVFFENKMRAKPLLLLWVLIPLAANWIWNIWKHL